MVRNEKNEWELNPIKTVCVMKGAQLGCSYMALHWLASNMIQFPAPSLVIGPTEDYMKRLANLKIKELLTTTEPLRDMVRRSVESNFGQERLAYYFPHGSLMLIGANSPADLRMLSARFALIDDMDACPATVGNEGDLLGLVRGRLSSFGPVSKLLAISSPTISGLSNIEALWEQSDQRHFHFTCPVCDHFVRIAWKNIKFVRDDLDVDPTFECDNCLAHSTEEEVKAAMAHGIWKPKFTDRDVVGFHVSALLPAWVNWRDLAQEFVAATGDVKKLQAFINLRLGEPFEKRKRDDGPQIRELMKRRKVYDLDQIPEQAFVTGGCDVQGDRIEVLIESWDKTGQSWFVAHHVVRGDPSVTEGMSIWAELGQYLESKKVLALGIDSGGLATSSVYDAAILLQEQFAIKTFLLKGASTAKDSFVPEKRGDATVVIAPRTGRRVELFLVDVNRGKEELFAQIKSGFRH